MRCLNADDCRSFGPYISLHVEFSQDVKPDSVEKAWQIEPPSDGEWIWENNRRARWVSYQPFPAGQHVRMGFRQAVIGQNLQPLSSDYFWEAAIRVPSITFLANTSQGLELFQALPFSQIPPLQLSQTSGKVIDYAASRDGEQIAYSVSNDLGGADIWLWDRKSGQSQTMLACQHDICTAPAWSPVGDEIAFTREAYVTREGATHLPPRVWWINLLNRESRVLFNDDTVYGHQPSWSPDGHWITFWGGLGKGVEVVNRFSGDVFSIPSSSGDIGCWSLDSRSLYFSDLVQMDVRDHIESLYSALYRARLDQGEISIIAGGLDDPSGYSYLKPVCHPLGEGFSVYVRPSMNIPGRALWWLDETGGKIAAITNDLSVINAHAAWSPDGSMFMFSVNQFNAVDDGVEVMVWKADQKQPPEFVIGQVYQPAWLP